MSGPWELYRDSTPEPGPWTLFAPPLRLDSAPDIEAPPPVPPPPPSPVPASVSPALVDAVIGVESDHNPLAVSSKGASGLMQVMPATARKPGFGVQPLDTTKLFDEKENVRFGTDYLGAMLKRYNGDVDAALAAYNGGPGRADAWIKGGKDMSLLPAETRDYIVKVKARLARAEPSGGASAPIAFAQTPAAPSAAPESDLIQKVFTAPSDERRNILERHLHDLLGAPFDLRAPPGTIGLGSPLKDPDGPVPLPPERPELPWEMYAKQKPWELYAEQVTPRQRSARKVIDTGRKLAEAAGLMQPDLPAGTPIPDRSLFTQPQDRPDPLAAPEPKPREWMDYINEPAGRLATNLVEFFAGKMAAPERSAELPIPAPTTFLRGLKTGEEIPPGPPSMMERITSAPASFAQGVVETLTGLPKQVAVAQGQERFDIKQRFDAIDAGVYVPPLPPTYEAPPVVGSLRREFDPPELQRERDYYTATPEQRVVMRKQFGVDQFDPRQYGLYKGAEAVEKKTKQLAPTDPRVAEEFLFGKVPHGLGSLVGFAMGAMAGRGLGMGRVMPPALGGMALQASEQFEDAVKKGGSFEQAFKASNMGGVLGLSEAVPIAHMLDRLDRLTKGSVKKKFLAAVGQGTEEAIQEFFQDVGSDLIASKLVGYDPERQMFTGSGEAAAVGFTTGALGYTLLAMFGAGARRLREGRTTRDTKRETEDAGALAEAQRALEQPAIALPDQSAPPSPPPAAAPATSPAEPVPQAPPVPAAAAPLPLTSPDDAIAILRAQGYPDDAIADMDPEERTEAVQEAREQGVTAPPPSTPVADAAIQQAPDRPSAEPARDLKAQAGDLAADDTQRQAVWLSKDNVASMAPETMRLVRAAGVPVENFDGQGGVLIARDQAVADRAVAERDGGRDLQAILGELTGAGAGKPADAAAVVQQVTPDGAVTQESVARAPDVPQAVTDLAAPGRDVRVVTPEAAVARREEEIAAERGDGTRTAPVKVETAEDIAAASAVVNTQPSEPQKEAGNYQKGHISVAGLDISIENPKGSTRSGTAADGKPWSVQMPAAYGYIKGTPARSRDKEHVDVYIGNNPTAPKAFVVNQFDLTTHRFDEAKIILGVDNQRDAADLYDRGFDDGSGPSRRHSIIALTTEQLRQVLQTHDFRRPVRRQIATESLELPARPESQAGVWNLENDEVSVPEPKRDGVQAIRGQGGREAVENEAGSAEVSAASGDVSGRSSVHAEEPAQGQRVPGVQRGENDPAAMGAEDGTAAVGSQAAGEGWVAPLPGTDRTAQATKEQGGAGEEVTLPSLFSSHFRAGQGFDSIVQARAFARDAGHDLDNKAVEEALESGIVQAARGIVAEGKPPAETYAALVDLYRRQPRLGTRTGTSVTNQAYSTPVPLAYLASRLAGVAEADTVYEPTAGTGMLLIEADPQTQTVIANEIDPGRADILKGQGFQVTQRDASLPEQAKAVRNADAVIMNPPFGAVREGGASKTFKAGDWSTTAIDHAIALNGLDAMADGGKAVLLLGGVKAETEVARRAGYRGKAKREFYFRLYRDYNVTDHFTADGSLYERQGAGWPVDVVVIEGRGKSQRPLPAASPPTIFSTWDSLAEKLPDADARDRDRPARPDRQPSDEAAGAVRRPERGDAGGRESTAGRGPERLPERAEDDAVRVGAGSDRGQPADVRTGARHEDRVPPGTDREPGRDGEPAVAGRKRVEDKPNAAGQTRYVPASTAPSLDSLVPVNMAAATRSAMERTKERHGPPDVFVAERLGYSHNELPAHFSAEQIDALAIAIDNVERGTAAVIGDSTGTGKGRIAAGMLRYAMRHGMVPVFVTEKPDLYGDMFRDMNDIGLPAMLERDVKMFMTNAGESVPLDEEALNWKQESELARAEGRPTPKRTGAFLVGGGKAKQDSDMRAILSGTSSYDVVFTTYDQMNTVRKGETARRGFLKRLARQAMLVLDETHNAGGSGQKGWQSKDAPPDRAAFVRELVADAKGVMYSSATYAKRPDVMDLYVRTDMGQAVDDPKDLPDLIAKGGVPMQQVVATMLSESGQYIRRERSFDGVDYQVEGVSVDAGSYQDFSNAVRAVFQFDLAVSEVRDEHLKDVLDAIGARTGKDAGVGEAAAHTTAFASVMHNIVGQMLLAIKAGPVAQRAIAAHKAGEKPVIGLSNTMESFISDFAAAEGIKFGDVIDLSFRDVLARYLARTLRISVKDGEGKKSHVNIPPADLPLDLQRRYRAALDAINDGDYAGLPVSPIDWMRHELMQAGLRVAEVTGRKGMVDYGDSPPRYVARPKREMGPAGKRSSIAAFNRGALDALVINRSGSTGVSMHASKDFKDQKPRRMILAQSEPNIDSHVQMLGRIHRTGQVTLPAYSQVAAEIPAEARPIAILMNKMASLNANTTASRRSVFTAETADFMNEYGDKIVAEMLVENPDLDARLGGALKFDDDGRPKIEGAARAATGRLILLDPDEQARVLDDIQAAYKAEISQRDAMGENALEAKTLDLQARTIDATPLKERTGDGPFRDGVWLEKVSVKAQGRAMAPGEVAADTAKTLGVAKPDSEDVGPALDALRSKGREWADAKIAAVRKTAIDWINAEVGGIKDPAARTHAQEKYTRMLRRWQATADIAHPGARVTLGLSHGDLPGVVTALTHSGKAKNPVALGSWEVHIAVPDSARTFVFPMSRLFPPSEAKSEDEAGATVAPSRLPAASLVEMFEEARREGREERYIVTGNILAGYDQVHGRGQIINYTTEDGRLRPGILMGRGFSVEKFMQSRAVRLRSGEQIARFLERVPGATIKSTDGVVELSRARGEWQIETAAGRRTGGRYYTEPSVRQALGRAEFVRSGPVMRVELGKKPFMAVVDAMREAGAVFETRESQDIAQEIMRAGEDDPGQGRLASIAVAAPQQPTEPSRPILRVQGEKAAQFVADINDAVEIVQRIAGPAVPIDFYNVIAGDQAMGTRAREDMDRFVASIGDDARLADTSGGFYSPAGVRGEALIGLATQDPLYDLKTTAGHEAWHHVELTLATAAERRLLSSPAEQERMRRYAAPELDLAADSEQLLMLPAYEVSAYAFQRWRREREEGMQPSGGLHIGIRRFFDRIYRLLAAVRNVMRGHGFQTFEDIFERARTGEMARREQPPPDADSASSVAPRGPGKTGASAVMGERVASVTFDRPDGTGRSTEAPAEGHPYSTFNFFRRHTENLLSRAMPASDAARVKLQDKALPIRRIQEEIERATGIKLPLNLDVYVAEALYYGRGGERLIDLGDLTVEPLAEVLRNAEITVEQFGDYLYARHAAERNRAIAEIDPDNPEGSGMSEAEADRILDQVRRSGKQAQYETAGKMLDDMQEETRKTLLRSGLIDRETYDAWSTQYAHYVPLRGFEAANEDMAPERPRTGFGFDVRGPEAKRALGRRSKADNPLIYAVMQAQQAIVRAEKNRVDKTLLRLVQAHPNDAVWNVYRGEYQRRFNPDTGLVEKYWSPPQAFHGNRDDLFGVKVGGKVTWLEIKHPALRRSLRGVGSEIQGTLFGRGLFKLTRLYASLLTTYSPEFMVSNFFRDVETALINVSDIVDKPADTRRRIIKDAVSAKAIRGILSALRGKGKGEYAVWFDEYRKAGGKISWLEYNDVDRIRRRINNSLNESNMRRALRGAAELVEDINSAVENGVRLSTYIALRKAGVAQNRAAFVARELTVNFNRKGEWGPGLNAAYLFFNASAQGTVRIAQAVARSKAARYAVGGIFATGVALDVMNYLVAGDDDDGENAYDKIPEWVKERNLIVMIPGDSAHGYVQIPLAYGYNVPYFAGQQLSNLLRAASGMGKQKSALGTAASVLSAAFEAFNPIGSSVSLAQFASPTLLDPYVQLVENKTWFGAPIQPRKFDLRKPDSENYFATAPWWAVDTAKWLNRQTGGSSARSGLIDISPEAIQHYAEFAAGGVGKFVLNAFNTGERLVTGEEWLPEKTPFVRRVYGKATTESRRRDFFEVWNEVDKAKYEFDTLRKAGDRAGALAAREQYPAELRAHGVMKSAADNLRTLRKQRDTVNLDRALSNSEKRRRLDALVERENTVILRALGVYRRVKKTQSNNETTR